MMDGMNNSWGMGYGYVWIIGLIVLIVVIGIIVIAVQRRKNSKSPRFNSPLDILKKRYAKGEISKDEYEEKRRQISE